jgi:hypothetical protein
MHSQLPELSEFQLESLRKFLRFEMDAEALRPILAPLITFTIDGPDTIQTLDFRAGIPKRSVRVTIQDLDIAEEKARKGEISKRRLQQWASMLLMNGAFDWAERDEDIIAERLNEICW